MNMNDGLYIGVDGCRGGWIACILIHGEHCFERYGSLEELVSRYPEFNAFLIDMAVGLRSSADQLRPDDLARKELGQKASSIFPIPCRQAVYADTEEEQRQANIRILGKSLSKQTIHIIPKIRIPVAATLAAGGMCETIPAEPEQDENGLYMKLTIPKKSIGTPANGQKVAVVTGGANGIGKCIAEEFRKKGVKVYVIDKAAGDHYVGDISDKAVLEAFAEKVILENGGIDGGMTKLMIYHDDHGWTYTPEK